MITDKGMNRREMIRGTVSGAALLSITPGPTQGALGKLIEDGSEASVKGKPGSRPAGDIKIGRKFRWANRENESDMLFLKQIGVSWIKMYWGGKDTPLSELAVQQDRFSKCNLKIYGIAYGSDSSDEGIQRFCEFIWACKKNEIPLIRTGFGPGAAVGSTDNNTRPGREYKSRIFDLAEAKKKWTSTTFVSAEPQWEKFAKFLGAVLPEAEKAGVKLAYHPIDPPIRVQNNVESVLWDYNSYKRAEQLSKGSPSWGLALCVGVWAQGGDTLGKNPVEMIQDFGARDKIFMVDFRNVDRPLPRFQEVFPDDGYLDMYAVMKELRKVGFDGLLIPDHIPAIDGDGEKSHDMRRAGTSLSIGYIRGLMQAANSELGLPNKNIVKI